MTDGSATVLAASAPPAWLEPDAIGITQDTVIGLATSAPAGTMAATLLNLPECHRPDLGHAEA